MQPNRNERLAHANTPLALFVALLTSAALGLCLMFGPAAAMADAEPQEEPQEETSGQTTSEQRQSTASQSKQKSSSKSQSEPKEETKTSSKKNSRLKTQETHDHTDWTAWETTNALPTTTGSYYLSDNVTLTATWTVPTGTVNLCLNGHSITMSPDGDTETDVIKVPSGATLNLYDCSEDETGKITHASDKTGRGINVAGTLNMYGGTVTGNTATKNGAGVCVADGATLTVSGAAKVTGNKKKSGTKTLTNNVYLSSGRKIALNGELATGASLGVTMESAGTFTSGYKTAMGDNAKDPSTYFTSDDSDYAVLWNSAESEGVLSEYYDVTVDTAIINGTVTADPTKATEGTKITLTATPDDGYQLKSLVVTEVTSGAEVTSMGTLSTQELETQATSSTCTFSMPDDDVLVTAEFSAISYNVTVTTEGGGSSTAAAGASTATVGTAVKLTATPASGYKFKAWKVVSGGATISDASANPATLTMGTADAVVKATFEANSYTIHFDSNEPAYAAKKGISVTGTMGDQTATCGEKTGLNENKFGITHYKFAGWNIKSDGTGDSYANKASVTDLATAGGTATLYAQWTPDTYYVTFNSNGGTGTMDKQAFTYGESQALTANAFTRSGYDFSGWNTAKDGSGTSFSDKTSVNLAKDVTLYAQWTTSSTTATVTFKSNGGTGTMAAQTVTKGASVTLNSNTFTRSGYTFSGWNTKKDGSGTAISDGAKVTVKKNVTLYAQWTKGNFYTVTFDSNGGTGTMAAQNVTKGSSATLNKNTFTRSGYTFKSWNTKKDGSGTSLADGAKVKVTSNVTLYAQWTKGDTCTITFVSNGGTGTMPAQTVTKGATATLNPNKFTRSGYIFTGWNTKADGTGTSLGNGSKVKATSNVTLYAQWRASSSGSNSGSNSSSRSSSGTSRSSSSTSPLSNTGDPTSTIGIVALAAAGGAAIFVGARKRR